MRKPILIIIGLCCALSSFAQTDYKTLIGLGKWYKNFMFRNDPTKEEIREIETGVPDNLKFVNEFIVQTCITKNKLLTDQFLTRPTDEALKQIFIVRAVDLNFREPNPVDPQKLIDSLMAKEISGYELLD